MNKMLRYVIVAGVAALTIGCGSAGAQGSLTETEARLDKARQHVDAVCQPLEARRLYRLATRCYGNVTAYLDNPQLQRIEPVPPTRIAAPRPMPTFEPAYRVPRRAGSLFASNFVLLGVGF